MRSANFSFWLANDQSGVDHDEHEDRFNDNPKYVSDLL